MTTEQATQLITNRLNELQGNEVLDATCGECQAMRDRDGRAVAMHWGRGDFGIYFEPDSIAEDAATYELLEDLEQREIIEATKEETDAIHIILGFPIE